MADHKLGLVGVNTSERPDRKSVLTTWTNGPVIERLLDELMRDPRSAGRVGNESRQDFRTDESTDPTESIDRDQR